MPTLEGDSQLGMVTKTDDKAALKAANGRDLLGVGEVVAPKKGEGVGTDDKLLLSQDNLLIKEL